MGAKQAPNDFLLMTCSLVRKKSTAWGVSETKNPVPRHYDPCPISSGQRAVCSAVVCGTTAAGETAKTALLRTHRTISTTARLPISHRVDPDGLCRSATLTLLPHGSVRGGPRPEEAPVMTRTAGRSWDDPSFRCQGCGQTL